MNATICEAIRTRRRLEFVYNARPRVVEPYCHGMSTAGAEVLRAVQVRGASRSAGFGFGKLWTVARISELRLGDPFDPDDPNYNPNDSAMRQVHCRIRAEGAHPGPPTPAMGGSPPRTPVDLE